MEELERAVIPPGIQSVSFSWDAFCNLLDDRPSNPSDSGSPVNNLASSIEPSSVRAHLVKSGQYFFPSHASRHSLEVFWLKLCLLESLCRQVAVVHRNTEHPLLRLDSQHVRVALPSNHDGYLPILWRGVVTSPCPLETTGVSAEDMPVEMEHMVSLAPTDTDPAYLSPLIREWPAGREVRGTALIESVDVIPGDDEHGAQGLIRLHFISDSIVAEDFSTRDVFGLTIPLSSGTVRLWARKVESPERGIVLSGVTAMLSCQALQSLQHECHQVISRTVARIYRSHPPTSDIYSLGMLFLRALIGSDPTRWDAVVHLLPTLLNSLPPAVQGIDAGDAYTTHTRVREFLQEQDNLFLNSGIPDDLWWDGIVIALRALSRIPDFSYESLITRLESRSNEFSADLLLIDAAQLGKRAKIELFESDERDAAIAGACIAALHQFGMA